MGPHKNIIGKQNLHFHFEGNEDGFMLQKEITDWCAISLNPAIEALLNEYGQTDEVIQLNELELSVDIYDRRQWQKLLCEKIVQQIRENLELKKNGMQVLSGSAAFLQVLICFLKNGVLPWNAGIDSKAAFDESFEKQIALLTVEDAKGFVDVLKDKKAVMRLSQLLCVAQFVLFTEKILNDNRGDIKLVMMDIEKIVDACQGSIDDQKKIYNSFMMEILASFPEWPREGLLDKAIRRSLYQISLSPGQLKKIDVDGLGSASLRKEILMMEENKTMGSSPAVFTSPGNIDPGIELEKGIDLEEGIYINNAGAVIIAAFLPRLFLQTGLVKNGRIDDLPSALQLVHYCVTGDENAAEFELLLLKILCGTALQQPIEMRSEINNTIKHEAESMLGSVIEHWDALKNTSIAGLRQSFLQRKGKLSFKNGEWMLQVETKSYDILLQQLPWNISMIKLPWMKDMLKTEWIF